MKSESVGNVSKLQELRDYIDELHAKIDYDDYVNLINLVDEIDTQFNCQEDLKDYDMVLLAKIGEPVYVREKMKSKELKEKLSKIEDDEEIFIKAEVHNKYGHQDILFISFDDLTTEDGKTYLTLERIIEEQEG